MHNARPFILIIGSVFNLVYYEKELEREYVYKGKIINLRVDKVEMPGGNIATREVVEHNGGVGVLPVDKDNMVYLVRQYRRPVDRELLEIPAGKLAPGEDPLKCGIRELKEETGLTAEKYTCLCKSLPTPGYTSETIYLYLAINLVQGEAQLEKDEYLNVEKYSLEQAVSMAMKGKIVDGKTLIALFMANKLLNG